MLLTSVTRALGDSYHKQQLMQYDEN